MVLEPVFNYSFSQFLIDITRKWRYWLASCIAPAFTPRYTPRPMFQYMQKQGMFNLVGAEIGVFKGKNAKSIMELIKPAKLFLIDPYKEYLENDQIYQFKKAFRIAQDRMQPFKDKVVFVKKVSSKAIEELPALDFVYVDGNHEYKYVKEDLKLYYEKLRNGGVIGGHDFNAMNVNDVCRAVIEFGKWHNLKPYGARIDFWFIKGS